MSVQPVFYNQGLIITALQADNATSLKPLEDGPARMFQRFVTECLDKLKQKPTGARLLGAIDQIGARPRGRRTCKIVWNTSSKGSAAEVENISADFQRYTLVTRQYLERKSLGTTTGSPYFALTQLITKIESMTNFKRANIARLCGFADETALRAVEAGTVAPTGKQILLISANFYKLLEPGPGVNTIARLDLHETYRHADQRPAVDEGAVAPFIALGHELVHAWRMMAGLRIVDQVWEEEAMTVGLPPFSGMEFTENRLLSEHDRPVRSYYNLTRYFEMDEAHMTNVATWGSQSAFDGRQSALDKHRAKMAALAEIDRALPRDWKKHSKGEFYLVPEVRTEAAACGASDAGAIILPGMDPFRIVTQPYMLISGNQGGRLWRDPRAKVLIDSRPEGSLSGIRGTFARSSGEITFTETNNAPREALQAIPRLVTEALRRVGVTPLPPIKVVQK